MNWLGPWTVVGFILALALLWSFTGGPWSCSKHLQSGRGRLSKLFHVLRFARYGSECESIEVEA